jgi:hypothetical protein
MPRHDNRKTSRRTSYRGDNRDSAWRVDGELWRPMAPERAALVDEEIRRVAERRARGG